MKQWNVISQKQLLKTRPFSVEELLLSNQKTKEEAVCHRLICPDWINVLPVTADGQAILIKQSRVGILTDTLETPGGCVDDGEKDVTQTAARELEEETGFVSQRLLPLASIPANPAIHSNFVHYFLALNCTPATERKHFPDLHEEIAIEHHPYRDLDLLIRLGKINNPYSALCILLASKYLANHS